MPLIQDMYSKFDTYLLNTTPYSAIDNGTYHVDATSGVVTFNLPDISTIDGMYLYISKIDVTANAVVVTPFGTQKIGIASSISLVTRYDLVVLVSRGGNWYFDNSWYKLENTTNRANDGNFSFFNPAAAKDYIEVNNTAWTVFATFVYRGSSVWTPTKAFAILSRSSGSGTSSLRVYDASNSQVIMTYNWTSATRTLYTITGLTNLPINPSIFEFQAQRSASNAGTCLLHAIGLYP